MQNVAREAIYHICHTSGSKQATHLGHCTTLRDKCEIRKLGHLYPWYNGITPEINLAHSYWVVWLIISSIEYSHKTTIQVHRSGKSIDWISFLLFIICIKVASSGSNTDWGLIVFGLVQRHIQRQPLPSTEYNLNLVEDYAVVWSFIKKESPLK